MSKISRYSAEQKYNIITEAQNGKLSTNKILARYQITYNTLKNWKHLYQRYGITGLKKSNTWKNYSSELKNNAVLDYLSGNFSLYDVIRKYEISSVSLLRDWIKKYNSHSELNNTQVRKVKTMTKGRNTTLKEKVEIAEYCIANNDAYQEAADKYDVSYQQVYQWVRKYKKDGINALKDGRGRKKSVEELTPEEIIELKFKKLEAENKRLRAENALLKKLEELERGW